ncbi:hypothetical protein FA10DRAFT_264175 [Acaromyces ingoldii]|uniref:Haem-binding uptake Tiki superfamily ChaN domain-containing protein n=1 Tax=Acaromyces ingoldii TaxID=215250 RepID=A0A316YW93_9BASI|nr:hypothetical protein FA10DRAFT_264175 [Acaromyces ingoldii]PWN93539.1 hypothetical protein FA10DRAFT_264175 [Acaromyces ingoldii]
MVADETAARQKDDEAVAGKRSMAAPMTEMAKRMSWLVGRLSPPHVVDARHLPRYWQTTQLRREQPCQASQQQDSSEEIEAETDRTQGSSPHQIDHLLASSSSSSSLSSSFAPSSPSTIEEIVRRSRKHRVIFFGEQHHQPEVLSAQLQLLLALVKDRRREHGKDARVHLVLEQFNLVEQPLLNRAAAPVPAVAEGEEQDKARARPVSSQEGFDLRHYWPLVQLARENDVKVWAGFPPRSWASLLARGKEDSTAESEEYKQQQQKQDVWSRIQQLDSDRFIEAEPASDSVVPPMRAEQKWSLISHVSWPHRSYLRSLFRPEEPAPCPPENLSVAARATENTVTVAPPEEKTGFLAAQALKDTYLAHVVDHVLDLPATLTPLSSASAADSSAIDQVGKRHNDTVLVICGAGHCEWGFGAVERLRAMRGRDAEQPLIVLSKPRDSHLWVRDDHDASTSPSQQATTTESSASPSPPSHHPAGWNQRLADFICLYDWVDV